MHDLLVLGPPGDEVPQLNALYRSQVANLSHFARLEQEATRLKIVRVRTFNSDGNLILLRLQSLLVLSHQMAGEDSMLYLLRNMRYAEDAAEATL